MNISTALVPLVYEGETRKRFRETRGSFLWGSIRLVGGWEGGPQGTQANLTLTLGASSSAGT